MCVCVRMHVTDGHKSVDLHCKDIDFTPDSPCTRFVLIDLCCYCYSVLHKYISYPFSMPEASFSLVCGLRVRLCQTVEDGVDCTPSCLNMPVTLIALI